MGWLMNKNIAAVILAAGLSRRMGQPKMLLPWGKSTVLGQVVATFAEAGVSELVIITGGARQAVEAEASRLAKKYALRWVYNPDFESGEMTSSLQVGLGSLSHQIQAALVGLGDQPQLSPQAVLKVTEAFKANPAGLIVPSYNHRRGHPWLVQQGLWSAILGLKPNEKLRDFLNAHAADIHYVETDDSVLKDLDTSEDYQREKP